MLLAENGFMPKLKVKLPWMSNYVCIGHTANLPLKYVMKENTALITIIDAGKLLNAYYRTSSVTTLELEE